MNLKMLDFKTVKLLANQIMMNQTLDMTLFVIRDWNLTTSSDLGGVRMTIVLKRKIMNEMMTTYLPSLLLILITYATTFFKPYFFEAGLSVNLTTMLVMTTIFMTVMQMLPATAYVKMIDVFLIAGQLYPFTEVVLLTLMEFTREGDGSGHMDEVDDLPDVKFFEEVSNVVFAGEKDTPISPSGLSLDPVKAKKMSSVKKIYYYQLIGKKYVVNYHI